MKHCLLFTAFLAGATNLPALCPALLYQLPGLLPLSDTTVQQAIPTKPTLQLLSQHPKPVLSVRSPGAKGIRFGYEGGTVVKVGKTYHLFTSEMMDNPMWVKMRLGHWTSTDRLTRKRWQTVRASTGDYTGTAARVALWSPMVVWDAADNRWNFFYIAYHSAPNRSKELWLNAQGRIWRAIAETMGKEGINGSFKDVGIIMQPDAETESWEGLQGVDSFFFRQVNGRWHAFCRSCKSERMPIQNRLVGFAKSQTPALAGPWKRMPAKNPAPMESVFIENPIVTALPNGSFLCVYDNNTPDAIGWWYSADGLTRERGRSLTVQPNSGDRSKDITTCLGPVDEGDGRYTLFSTGFEQDSDWDRLLTGVGKETCAVGFVELTIKP